MVDSFLTTVLLPIATKQSIKAYVSYSNFKNVVKEENYKEKKTNFEGAYLWRIQL